MRTIYAETCSEKLVRSAAAILLFGYSIVAQSALQDHPTPITRNEIEATVKARDVGDARLTTHYYWFEGAQGDVFINWTSKNFAGDVDLFVQNGSRSLTKIVVYADFGEVETGRVIYLRKPERLLLRVQGRTPNDDAATYRLKFAGSFVAAAQNEKDVPMLPSVGENVSGTVRVNSVGTILPPLPKPVEAKADAALPPAAGTPELPEPAKAEAERQTDEKQAVSEEKTEPPKLEVVVDDPIKKVDPPSTPSSRRPPRKTRTAGKSPVNNSETKVEKKDDAGKTQEKDMATPVSENDNQSVVRSETEAKETVEEKPKMAAKADPLANVHLVIMFKDGRKIERPLPEVFRFSVDRGVLTVVSKDGRVGKYQMIDVSKVTIE